MIVVDRAKLKFLLAGRMISVDWPRECRKGRTYAVGVRHKHPICRAEVIEILQVDGGYTLRLRQAPIDDLAHYLAASPGAIRADYTTNPARAAREPDGSPIEAVDVGGRWSAKISDAASERDDLIRRERVRQDKLSRWRTLRPKAL